MEKGSQANLQSATMADLQKNFPFKYIFFPYFFVFESRPKTAFGSRSITFSAKCFFFASHFSLSFPHPLSPIPCDSPESLRCSAVCLHLRTLAYSRRTLAPSIMPLCMLHFGIFWCTLARWQKPPQLIAPAHVSTHDQGQLNTLSLTPSGVQFSWRRAHVSLSFFFFFFFFLLENCFVKGWK